MNYYFFDQPAVIETLKILKNENKLENLIIDPNLKENKFDLIILVALFNI